MVTRREVRLLPAKIPRIAVYLEEPVKEALEELANREKRSLSQMCAILIEQGIDRARDEGKISQK